MYRTFLRSFLDTTTIHGLAHLTIQQRRHPVETVMWLSLIVVAIYGTAILSTMTLQRYTRNPTVISMERDRFSWNTSFPAATICPHEKVNQAILDRYVAKYPTKNKVEIREFLESLLNSNYYNLDQVVHRSNDNTLALPSPEQYWKLLVQMQFEFNPSISNSGVNQRSYYLQKIVSEMGVCYTFNSKLAIYSTPEWVPIWSTVKILYFWHKHY